MSFERNDGLDTLSWGEGSLAWWRAGFQVMSFWQRLWLDNVGRTQGLFNVWPAAEQAVPWAAPWAALAERWEQQAQAFGASAGNAPGSAPSSARDGLRKPVELKLLEREIAAKQGRTTPNLGCLAKVEVVGGPAPQAEENAAAPAPVVGPAGGSVTSMLAMQAKSLAKAVRTPRQEVPAQAAGKAPAKALGKKVAAKAPSKASRSR